MNGYYWPSFREAIDGIDWIDFSQIEFISDDEKFPKNFLGPPNFYIHECPRCKSKKKLMDPIPHCPSCNWDWLTDPGQKQILTINKKDTSERNNS